jgi:hypothetical protein
MLPEFIAKQVEWHPFCLMQAHRHRQPLRLNINSCWR